MPSTGRTHGPSEGNGSCTERFKVGVLGRRMEKEFWRQSDKDYRQCRIEKKHSIHCLPRFTANQAHLAKLSKWKTNDLKWTQVKKGYLLPSPNQFPLPTPLFILFFFQFFLHKDLSFEDVNLLLNQSGKQVDVSTSLHVCDSACLVFQISSNLLCDVFKQGTAPAQSLPPVSTSFQRDFL